MKPAGNVLHLQGLGIAIELPDAEFRAAFDDTGSLVISYLKDDAIVEERFSADSTETFVPPTETSLLTAPVSISEPIRIVDFLRRVSIEFPQSARLVSVPADATHSYEHWAR